MSGFNRNNYGFFERENISITWFWVPPSSSLVQKTLNNDEHTQYLFNFIPVKRTLDSIRNALNIPLLNTNYNFFLKKNSFPSTTIEWSKLDLNLRKAEVFFVFKTDILKFIRLPPNSVWNFHNPKGLRLRRG